MPENREFTSDAIESPQRFETWQKDDKVIRVPVEAFPETMNPDPDGHRERLLGEGWRCIHADPIPGVEMVWRPIIRETTFSVSLCQWLV